ncbi:MAG: nodulation protein NfeD [Elusimicrobia bacterium]|nr:nodulation protein NfeD [Elusimicrobiota bacterium]
MLKKWTLFALGGLGWAMLWAQPQPEPGAGPLYRLSFTGTVDPVVKNYLVDGLARARDGRASAVLIRMDTPGGLLDATRDIVQAILNSPLPVIVYVGPAGARAASAGVFITLAADVAAMAPQTHLGAAHPVSVGGGVVPGGKESDEKSNAVMEEKAVSDTAAYARSLAAAKGRDPEWAEKAVRQSLSLTSQEALKKGVVDLLADDETSLLKSLTGRTVKKGDTTFTLRLEQVPLVNHEMTLLQRWLHTIANPNVAYLLLALGFYALIYEFSSPGIGLAGIAGVICLVLAFFSLQVLPLNYAGLALVVAGLIMMGLDIFTGAHGLLIFGGSVSLAIGSFFLFDRDQSLFRVSWLLILTVVGTSLGFFGVVVRSLWKLRRKKPVTGAEGLVGRRAEVRGEGQVFLEGALWSVEAGLENAQTGDRVVVVNVLGNRLVVRKEA